MSVEEELPLVEEDDDYIIYIWPARLLPVAS